MGKLQLLRNERTLVSLTPHPLAFLDLYVMCAFLTILGIALLVAAERLSAGYQFVFFAWLLALGLAGFVFSLEKVSRFPLAASLSVGLVGTCILWVLFKGLNINSTFVTATGIYTISISVLGYVLVEMYRRSFKYFMTNIRIVMSRGFFTKSERQLTYDKISDIHVYIPFLGKVFNFGTIIPITQSGFGLGTESTFAGMATGMSLSRRIAFLGFGGGAKTIQSPKARPAFELHTIPHPEEVKRLISQASLDFIGAIHRREIGERQQDGNKE